MRPYVSKRLEIVNKYTRKLNKKAIKIIDVLDTSSYQNNMYLALSCILFISDILLTVSLYSCVMIEHICGGIIIMILMASILTVTLFAFKYAVKCNSKKICDISKNKIVEMMDTMYDFKRSLENYAYKCNKIIYADTFESIVKYRTVSMRISIGLTYGYYDEKDEEKQRVILLLRDHVIDAVYDLAAGNVDDPQSYLYNFADKLREDIKYKYLDAKFDMWIYDLRLEYIKYSNNIDNSQDINKIILGLLDI